MISKGVLAAAWTQLPDRETATSCATSRLLGPMARSGGGEAANQGRKARGCDGRDLGSRSRDRFRWSNVGTIEGECSVFSLAE